MDGSSVSELFQDVRRVEEASGSKGVQVLAWPVAVLHGISAWMIYWHVAMAMEMLSAKAWVAQWDGSSI